MVLKLSGHVRSHLRSHSLFISDPSVKHVCMCVCLCLYVCLCVCLCKSPQDLLSTVQETPNSDCQRISFALCLMAQGKSHLEAHTESTN